ncbi:MAG: zf-TFIIB domain-containing protein [bacterium]
MNCPICKKNLEEMILSATAVDYCPDCLGLWFDKDELRQAKDNRDKNLRWLDVDLWKEKDKFKISRGTRLCPACRLPLYEVHYGTSGVVVDVCNVCHGAWLDRGEFAKIIAWIKQKANYEIFNKYLKNLVEETAEIFIGPEGIRAEILDFLSILKLLQYKLLIKNPEIIEAISQLPR